MSDAEQTGDARRDKSERLLAGRYRLGEVLGRGGMGTVWRAKDETLGRTVAVKELRFPSSIDEEEKRRLITRTLREAKAIARIRNTSAVTVYDVVDEDDRPWIVMELVEGKSLAEAIREDGTLTPRRAAEVGLAVLDVLRSAHREGILHRDVKPSNVLIAEDGRVVLTDFGIAQVEGDPSITSTGMLVGAPSYISPERARGHKPGPAADLWSLGGLLYAAVEGVPPYDKGSAIATLTAVMTEDVEQPVNAGPLEKVIYGLLAKDPEQRLDDAGARALLKDVIYAPETKPEPEPVEATKVVPLPPAPPKPPKASRVPKPNRLTKASKTSKGTGAAAGAAGAAGAAHGSVGSSAPAGNAGTATTYGTARPEGRRAGETADRLKGALQSVRKAAASATARGTGGAAGAAQGTANGTAANGAAGVPPRAPAKASLTDVVPRRTLVIVTMVVVLAVLGTVLALALGDDNADSKDNKGGDKAVSAGATGGGDPGKDEDKGKDSGKEDGQGTGTGDDGKDPGKDESGDPDEGEGHDPGKDDDAKKPEDGAESTYKHSQGFAIGLPKGWKYQSTGRAGARFGGPDGQKLLVGWTTTPKDNPVGDWKNQEKYMVRPQYDRIRIEKVGFRGWNTADWEFTYVDGGTKYRSIDRGFVVNGGLGYGMMYTAKADDWDGEKRRATWQTFTKTFEPKS
ncbi:serine/threonine protein kinase [Streptomyces venezuelae]|uniref:non-specific serine/threonine protein kinase n=1 Tax=Streptomyces venezuelae TaxID=54571 RepID=A0A5P2C1T9_STRVZ|nr:serine/threonine-protein kinase [Streptomyces venezuelae]QES34619.1 serine/threonine protein kinase [Streptomyces venezuelae]